MLQPFLKSLAVGVALLPVPLSAASPTLFATQPAAKWSHDSYPIGNGRLGAMAFGGVQKEIVQFNEQSLWSGDNNWDGGFQTGDHGFGNYRNFGDFTIEWRAAAGSTPEVTSPSGQGAGNGQGIENTLDGNAGTKWCIETPGAKVQWLATLPAAVAVKSYVLTSAPDVPSRDPQEWVLEGSADGKTWTALDRRKLNSPFEGRGQAKRFDLSQPRPCRSYRLTFTPQDRGHFQVSEVALEGVNLAASAEAAPADYRRELDLSTGIHTTRFTLDGTKFTREALASHPAQVLAFHYTAENPGALTGRITLKSAQGAATTAAGTSLSFSGAMPNTLRYAAALRLIPAGGKARVDGDALVFEGCDELTLLLDARTDYQPDFKANWRTGTAPAPQLDAAAKLGFAALRKAHVADISAFLARASINLGETPAELAALPTAERKQRYAAGGADPDLEELLFNYGRYLLVSSSRPGGLPANLQGLWCDSNNPPWASDYHTNINIQMNYWAAETTNLSECHLPLMDFITAQAEPCRIATRKAFGAKTRGWTARTSQSIFGGNGWNWNIPSSAWYATHAYEHWAFTRDRAFLAQTAYPLLKEICQMWEDRLKPLPDGTLVVPQGWSPEHGPTEDGVMHDQQLIWELFEDYLIAARELGADADYQKTIAGLQSRLAPNKIGKWGQLQEWQVDRDDPNDIHRHTSHLFAVFPGRQISMAKTPELAQAATKSLLGRSGLFGANKDQPFTVNSTTGDSRQSWTWPWRGAMWARLGEGEKSGIMVRGLLTHNTMPNLFAIACGTFQMDGNFGITAAMAEMLLQSHAGEIALLPALPAAWAKGGSFTGLRARGGFTVDCAWQDGKVTSFHLRAAKPATAKVRVNGELREVTAETN